MDCHCNGAVTTRGSSCPDMRSIFGPRGRTSCILKKGGCPLAVPRSLFLAFSTLGWFVLFLAVVCSLEDFFFHTSFPGGLLFFSYSDIALSLFSFVFYRFLLACSSLFFSLSLAYVFSFFFSFRIFSSGSCGPASLTVFAN